MRVRSALGDRIEEEDHARARRAARRMADVEDAVEHFLQVERRVDDLDDLVEPDHALVRRLAGGSDAEERAARALEVVRGVEPLEDADGAADGLRRFFRLLAQQADVEQAAAPARTACRSSSNVDARRVELRRRRLRARRATQWIFAQTQSFLASVKRSSSWRAYRSPISACRTAASMSLLLQAPAPRPRCARAPVPAACLVALEDRQRARRGSAPPRRRSRARLRSTRARTQASAMRSSSRARSPAASAFCAYSSALAMSPRFFVRRASGT